MQRKIYEALLKWKDSARRKPLVLEGARQVGKTYILKEFGEKEFDNLIYINCHNNNFVHTLFEPDFNIERVLLAITAYSGQRITTGRTMIFFDEVQDAPRCMESLKYFCEDARELHVAVAGSLLGIVDHKDESYPVGKVDTLQLYPMTFEEFLWAMNEDAKTKTLDRLDWEIITPLDSDLQNLLRQYYYVGGMPEVVLSYISTKDLPVVRKLQNEILRNYNNDFSKHAGDETQRVRMIWKSMPSQLARDNKKFIYGSVKTGSRAKEFEKAIQWLVDAGLAYKIHRCTKPSIPLSLYEDESAFKLFCLDVGLLGAMSNMPASLMLTSNDVFKEAKGSFTENYVLQQLKAIPELDIYYSSKDNSTQEIDFLVQKEAQVIPMEVKAEVNVKSKSLRGFICDDHKEKELKGLRCSMKPYIDQEWMENIPLYAVYQFIIHDRVSFKPQHTGMDKSKIESEGVIAFEHYINWSKTLSASLNRRDKEPIWDGDLHVYRNENYTNSNHIGVVRVQVKATMTFDSNAYAKFPVGVDELKAYNKDGGVLFIVVHVSRAENRCFYKALTPVKINQLLEKAEGQKTTTITLGPVPEHESDFESEMVDFLNDCRAQHSFKPEDYVSLAEMNGSKPISFSVSATGKVESANDLYDLMTSRPRQLYCVKKVDGHKINFPIKEGEGYLTLNRDENVPVSVNGVVYYDHIKINHFKGIHTWFIGKCLSFEEEKKGTAYGQDGRIQLHFNYKFQAETLSDAIADMRFSLAVNEHKEFYIGKQKFAFEAELDNVENLVRQLNRFEKLQQLLLALHVKEELMINQIKPAERTNIDALIQALQNGEAVYSKDSPQFFSKVSIGNVLLLLRNDKTDDGAFHLTDFWADVKPIQLHTQDNEEFCSSPYLPLRKEDFLSISNIDYQRLVESYEECKGVDANVYEHANVTLRAMLLAYDDMKGDKQHVLSTAIELAKWILANDPSKESAPIHKLNLLQALKRQRELTEAEQEDLYIILDETKDDQIKYAVFLLLDEQSSAARYFKRLDTVTQTALQGEPISHFDNMNQLSSK